jgi:hypothetical protein
MESTVPVAVWWLDTAPVPPGFLRINRMGWGELRVGNVYVQITRFPFSGGGDVLLVAAARQRVPAPN